MVFKPIVLLLLACWAVLAVGAGRKPLTGKGEFMAGSFILTQQSLLEAPYRYAGILRDVLDRVEAKQPPQQSDEENCDVRYRIEPSDRRSKLQIIDNSLSFTLKSNNTVVIKAKLDAQVSARTWIWKGINFGLLGCMKISSCNGQIVTYSASIDFEIAIQVFWDEAKEKMAINIKPVETEIHDVFVDGCKPPWYLFWFKKWQSLLNSGVQSAFQEFANNYEHQSDLPEEFSPLPNVFIHYVITGLEWSEKFIVFEAKAHFFTTIDDKNITFIPASADQVAAGSIDPIPMDKWSMQSRSDSESHLLQGVRISNEFINALMWMATRSNLTMYRGSARVLDTVINGTISYEPPIIRVEKNNLLSLDIGRGLLLATCLPVDSATKNSSILFKAEFTHLVGSGQIVMTSNDEKTGVRATLDSLDLSRLQTKPFEPKLPLPESFESDLMKTAISQLQPIVNQYLEAKPFYLPEKIAPLVASPQVHLFSTGNGTGYIEVISYCTCANATRSIFAACDKRSHICEKDPPPPTTEAPTTVIPTKKSFKDSIKSGFDKIKEIAGNVVIKNPFNKDYESGAESTTATTDSSELLPINFTHIFELSKNGNLSYNGFHFTFFEFSTDCQLYDLGSTAKTYWLWVTSRCTPIYYKHEMTQQFYFLSDSDFKFGCEDSECQKCTYDLYPFDRLGKSCRQVQDNQSYQVGKPLIYSWKSKELSDLTQLSGPSDVSIIANVFFDGQYCLFHPRYLEPQVLATHTNLGTGQRKGCLTTSTASYIRNDLSHNKSLVVKADWDCLENCYGCIFKVTDVFIESCHEYKEGIQVVFTRSIEQNDTTQIESVAMSNEQIIFLAAGIVCAFVGIIIISGLVVYCKRGRPSSANLKSSFKNFSADSRFQLFTAAAKAFFARNFGFRFLLMKTDQGKYIREDILQNLMVLINGILAILFAFSWNSENNPLLIIHEKFKTGLTISFDVLDTSKVVAFASRLNLISYLVNLINGSLALVIVVLWCITKTGTRGFWRKIRFLSSISLLGTIFCMLAAIIFSTYFDGLIVLEKDKGYFITDNKSVNKFANEVLKVSLSGMSLTVISFTIVFLFHSVGGGLYTGTVLFRLSHLHSKRPNMEILTTLLVILTIVQPFVCLHPVIIWSQDSNSNSTFLLLVILIWFLPVCIHVLVRAVTAQSLKTCSKSEEIRDATTMSQHTSKSVTGSSKSGNGSAASDKSSSKVSPSEKYRLRSRGIVSKIDTGRSRGGLNKSVEQNVQLPLPVVEIKTSTNRKDKFVKFFDVFVHLFQLAFFLTTFTVITHHIVNTELNSQRENLQEFVLPAIISVFFWTVSISYLVLSIVLDETRKDEPLVFKDQDLAAAKTVLRASLRRRLSVMDRQISRQTHSLQRRTFFEAAALQEERQRRAEGIRQGRTLPANVELSESLRGSHVPLNASIRVNVRRLPPLAKEDEIEPEGIPLESISTSSAGSNDESSEIEEDQQQTADSTWCGKLKRVGHFFLETSEYRDPGTHGWRIKFRRLCLTIGVIFFSYSTIHSTISTQSYSSKREIQKILDFTGTNLTWPDSGSVLDDVFQVYNNMESLKCYLMIGSTLIFWVSLILDFSSSRTDNVGIKSWLLTGSRVANFAGSLMVFASVIVVGLPDYLAASNLDTICPFCGYDFNRTVRQVAEFSIGLFFACLFTFQLFPILVTIAPALVRASVLILIHPQLQVENSDLSNLRMTILQRVIQFSSLLTFPITFISMAILQQYQKDLHVTLLIVAFWTFPPFILFVGLHFARKLRRYIILLYIYYTYNTFYVGLLSAILFYSLTLKSVLELLQNLLKEPIFWAGFLAQVSLCNVVISDMLYMTVF